MSGIDGPAADSEVAVSLAETYLEHRRQQLSSNLNTAIEEEIDRWRERKAELDEDDDLYAVAKRRIEKQEEHLEELHSNAEDVEEELLEVVAGGFTATGAWLDATLLRALNLILYGKYGDSFVVDRHVLEEDTELDDEDLFGVSRSVRRLARERLGDD